MADLDAELLALAGGDSSDEEDTKPTSSDAQGSPNLHPATDTTPTHEVSSNKVSLASKPSITLNGASSKNMKKGRNNDSEEEGEA